ncbi:tellurite resistance protein TerB [Rhodoblastus acidophilus]|uniref:Tellurite resistance protein TerB n=1 Tax=Rhodoblastus acidophilus TaxID=1074 RepID=A0A212SG61_RHOAC|nr:tellurite resistance TerB family protein [Rhodoblastus acidophilus]PPQ34826.1 Tellurite resistance TerB [Rhodoblastus acidophilus]RAI16600.1 Tellurite resistance TerB [Rhodoblastus acidophilus]SNB84584.1 tellurite resistance protein TerB [Rhodoblastus acidophilus]
MLEDWIKTAKDKASEASKKFRDEVAKFKNREFLEATVAGCALVASADGSISSEEKKKMLGFIQASDELKVFKVEDVIAVFNQITAKFEFDADIGKIEALKVIGRLKSNAAAARTMVRVCCVIGASDGTFDDSEKAIVRSICDELGLNPSEFGL